MTKQDLLDYLEMRIVELTHKDPAEYLSDWERDYDEAAMDIMQEIQLKVSGSTWET